MDTLASGNVQWSVGFLREMLSDYKDNETIELDIEWSFDRSDGEYTPYPVIRLNPK